MRGRCPECKTLRRIRPLSLQFGSRQCEYGALDHDLPDRHADCGGVVEYEPRVRQLNGVDENGDPRFEEFYVAFCTMCGPIDNDASVVQTSEPCPGSRKPIR